MNKDFFKLVFASGFGLGLAPIAPGSFAALVGVALHVIVLCIIPVSLQSWILVLLFVVVCIGNHILTDWAVEYWNDEDPSNFVLDEIAGYLFTILVFILVETITDFPLPKYDYWVMITLNFVLFRIFDIVKVPPANYIDNNFQGPFGILLDDLVSGAYAGILTTLIIRYIY